MDQAPEHLFEIAEAYREAGDCKNALFFYKRYTAMKPGASNRAEVEDRIFDLDAVCGTDPAPPTTGPGKAKGKKKKSPDLESPYD